MKASTLSIILSAYGFMATLGSMIVIYVRVKELSYFVLFGLVTGIPALIIGMFMNFIIFVSWIWHSVEKEKEQ